MLVLNSNEFHKKIDIYTKEMFKLATFAKLFSKPNTLSNMNMQQSKIIYTKFVPKMKKALLLQGFFVGKIDSISYATAASSGTQL